MQYIYPGIVYFLSLFIGPEYNNSLLWEIRKDGQVSYLMGTMHTICEEDFIWTPLMDSSLKNSDKVCFELDIDDESVPASIAIGLYSHSDKSLDNYFDKNTYTKLEDYFKKELDIDINDFKYMRLSILPLLLGESSKCNSISYEKKIMSFTDREIIGIEHPEEQIAILNAIPEDTIIKVVSLFLNGYRDTVNLSKLYKEQNITQIQRFVKNSNLQIDSRNIKWIPRMESIMKNNTTFFAFGAGHLWGEHGIISLLRSKGYIVLPLK